MLARILSFSIVLFGFVATATAQAPPAKSSGGSLFDTPINNVRENVTATGASVTRVTSGDGVLPNAHGQVWRQYDISPYTSRVTTTKKPEQAIIDWILRETGAEVWFSEPLGILSAGKKTLNVYHTPDMQRVVSGIVDRFVGSQAERYVYAIHMMTVVSPNWRSSANRMLRPVDVKTPGVEAWLISKENAAVLLGQLKKRTDFRLHNSPEVLVHNGQSQTIARTRPRNYVKGVRLNNTQPLGPELNMGQVDEGYSLELSPLISLNGRTIDAVVHCQVEQVEKFVSSSVDIPTATGQQQRVQVMVPQRVSWRMRERFRWPTDQALLISCGVVASPSSEKQGPLGFRSPLAVGPPRAEALLLILCNGKASQTLIDLKRAVPGAVTGTATIPRVRK